MLEKIKETISNSYSNDQNRRLLMFRILNLVLCAVSLVMSVMNIITEEFTLFWITATYSLLCLLNFLLSRRRRAAVEICFFAETVAMLSVFIVTGIPEGFSLLWTLLIPACAMAIFGRKFGTVFSAVLFAVIAFFFWLPLGRELLLFDYSDTYMLRFPVVYICMYLISFYVEWIRLKTLEKLEETEINYRWLYRHDALTGAYSRHAFAEEVESLFADNSNQQVATIMVDVDDFKAINDHFGHNAGDQVLCRLSEIILSNVCDHALSCRWGGEEFLIVMCCEHDPQRVAEQIRSSVEQTQVLLQSGQIIHFTVSAGVAVSRVTGKEQLPDQINRADRAMYISKAAGKNQVTVDR